VWSLGLTIIAAATGRNPWAPPDELNLFQLLKKISGDDIPTLPATFTPEAQDFIKQCLRREPEDRPDCRALLEHPFFAECTFESARATCKMLLTQTSRLVSSAAAKQKLDEDAGPSPTYSDDFTTE
jgi:serine/threonine protein kinase